MRVIVIGTGIIGLTTAVAVKENFPHAAVTLIGEKLTPETTGDGSAGLWSPYLLANTDPEKTTRWSLLTLEWMERFWRNGLAKEAGISLIPIFRVTSDSKGYSPPEWATAPYGFHKLSDREIRQLNRIRNSNFTGGIHYVAYTCELTKMLPWLMQKFESMDGNILKQKVTQLEEIVGSNAYDVVINCTGLGSRDLVQDKSIFPIRGQVTRVEAPWLLETFLNDDHDGNYIIPKYKYNLSERIILLDSRMSSSNSSPLRCHRLLARFLAALAMRYISETISKSILSGVLSIYSVVLGGTHQENDTDVAARKEDSTFILEGCKRLYPSIGKASVLREWVGFRPGRDEVRLESEVIRTTGGESIMVIHNYGHGGSGITLSWGCALDVVEILRLRLRDRSRSSL